MYILKKNSNYTRYFFSIMFLLFYKVCNIYNDMLHKKLFDYISVNEIYAIIHINSLSMDWFLFIKKK
ncbi:hypothetical protein PFNF135_05605 [Plasmodium falciparum NF135/5.C10]|uniref:Uncharacterized protein n=3 Tax=Plasmodium falciparum TaxID=5833 RepID=A0A024X1F1_PLAFC|nr:hypothetical protein PFNF135_05605 [Plasmodium falciparum NF135/5.C10]ETW46603.1 hypothetical protein PFMALIP_05506 [Plasmodium falciparum MaliPS096_E11]ETW58651.1 hypothetical protein PFMC_05748 [Plasmodium falciparum CAMP/Malaysia]